MNLLPEDIHETGPHLQWAIECQLRLIEEVACAPQATETDGPGREEAVARYRRAVQRRYGPWERSRKAGLAVMTAQGAIDWQEALGASPPGLGRRAQSCLLRGGHARRDGRVAVPTS